MSFTGHGDQKFGHITYSHCGEDLMVVNLFKLMGIEKPTYLDIGAHHPFNISNTALLYSLGARGVNVEANPKLIPAFLEHRPEDKTVNIGIADKAGKLNFYMWDDLSGRNTFSEEWSERLEQHKETIELNCITIGELLDKHCNGIWPDFLSMDIEGMDIAVLSQADFSKSRPKIICLEAWPVDFIWFNRILEPQGYFQYSRHAMDVIFVHEDFRELVY